MPVGTKSQDELERELTSLKEQLAQAIEQKLSIGRVATQAISERDETRQIAVELAEALEQIPGDLPCSKQARLALAKARAAGILNAPDGLASSKDPSSDAEGASE